MSQNRSTPVVLLATALLAACGGPLPGRRVGVNGKDAGDCLAAPCRTIGYAVAQARAGDTVSVDSGTYREAVTLSKRITLIGHHATIDAAGQTAPANGVLIVGDSSAGSRVAGFTIRHAGLEGIYVHRTSRVVIEDNVVEANDAYGPKHPICVHYQSDCGEAIHLQDATASVVQRNTIRGNMGGILLTDEDGPAADDTLADNTVLDNPKDCGITLASHWIDTASKSPVAEGVAGVYRNVVTRNTVNGNGGVGIGIFAAGPGGAAWGNQVVGNTAMHNGQSGIAVHGHTHPQNVDGNVIRDNIVSANGTDMESVVDRQPSGISVFSLLDTLRHTVVSGNRISNERVGVSLMHVEGIANPGANTGDGSVGQLFSVH
ncbi:MAG TPA: right-handed parallel beta-helix repeat-containing protein [Gemmatimonadaceae bacterium]|nr:right-handed parallel beta-helix repeat-containing protein [Gemmatimonadaceae bacterium]